MRFPVCDCLWAASHEKARQERAESTGANPVPKNNDLFPSKAREIACLMMCAALE
jgi:hypothetical protein